MKERGRWRALVALLGAVAVATASTSCGGDEEDSSGTDQTPAAARAPKGDEAPDKFMARLAAAVARTKRKADCKEVEDANDRSMYQFRCPAPAKFRDSMSKFEVTGMAVYGSGAVVDYRSGGAPDGASAVLYVNRDEEWGLSTFGLLYGPTVDSDDSRSKRGFDRTISSYLRAVRDRKCKPFRRYAITVSDDPKEVCEEEFSQTLILGAALRSNPDARPGYLGGNDRLGFYSLATQEPYPRFFTLSVITAGDGKKRTPLVLNVGPGPAPDSTPPKRTKPSEPALTTKTT